MSSEGMEVLRVVARIPLRQDTYPDGPDMVAAYQAPFLFGLTPDHVRQARAIVAAAERKAQQEKVWNPDAPAGQVGCAVDDDNYDHTVDCPEGDEPMEGPEAPPTAGPVPEAGAHGWLPIATAPRNGRPVLLWWRGCTQAAIGCWTVRGSHDDPSIVYEGWKCHDDQVIPYNQADCTHWQPLPATPSPQPPAPAEGAPDVAELIHKLESLLTSDRSTRAHRLHAILLVEEAEAIQEAADALTAQAAALAAKEAEIERLREALQEIKHHTHNADAAALWFGEINRIADAALSGKEPQQP